MQSIQKLISQLNSRRLTIRAAKLSYVCLLLQFASCEELRRYFGRWKHIKERFWSVNHHSGWVRAYRSQWLQHDFSKCRECELTIIRNDEQLEYKCWIATKSVPIFLIRVNAYWNKVLWLKHGLSYKLQYLCWTKLKLVGYALPWRRFYWNEKFIRSLTEQYQWITPRVPILIMHVTLSVIPGRLRKLLRDFLLWWGSLLNE